MEIYQNKHQYMVQSPSEKIQSIIQQCAFHSGLLYCGGLSAVFRVLCLHVNVGVVSAQCYRIGGVRCLHLENRVGNSLLKDFPYKDISPPLATGNPGIWCDVWIPDPSISSEKRADPGEQQGISNCMRERRKEKFVIRFRNKGKALIFFGGQHFSCFYCERILTCKSQVFWHLWWCCEMQREDCLDAKSLSVKCSGARDCLYHKFWGCSWSRHWCWKPIFMFIFGFWGKWNVGQGPSFLCAYVPHFVFCRYLLTLSAG